MRIVALDHGEARCGCAVSDPSGTLATPLTAIERPDSRRGLARVAGLAGEIERAGREGEPVGRDRVESLGRLLDRTLDALGGRGAAPADAERRAQGA